VFIVNARGETIAKTGEFKVGKAASQSCAGRAGVPTAIEVEYVGETSITLRWRRPTCNEAYGPVDAYELLIWDEKKETADSVQPTVVQSTRHTVDNLRADVHYALRMRSRSRAGVSDWSETVTTRTRSSTGGSSSAQVGGADGRKNMYNLRVVLSTPRSFLAWTPLDRDRAQITKLRFVPK
jgi:hypothetical protein